MPKTPSSSIFTDRNAAIFLMGIIFIGLPICAVLLAYYFDLPTAKTPLHLHVEPVAILMGNPMASCYLLTLAICIWLIEMVTTLFYGMLGFAMPTDRLMEQKSSSHRLITVKLAMSWKPMGLISVHVH